MKKIVHTTFIVMLFFMTMSVFTGCLKGGQSQPVSERNEREDVAGTKISSPAPRVRLTTTEGEIVIELFAETRPKTVQNFISLTESGFYNGTSFHRVIKDFMIQTGDPLSKDDDWSNDGTGGPGYTIEDEFRSDDSLVRGSVAMANTGVPHTNGSQFFIVTAQSVPWLNGKHTLFGRVVEGMDVVDKIESAEVNGNDHPLENIVITSADVLVDSDKI
ncbi:MAG: Peptidyl-prolyl cis-trans isomerase [Parcubacteria group bacterium GW2011_GWA2_43_13]|nr:MAG: Peptidyl-prolyl cis-trans isomerase [Parcubacteria group bacterium GW2011_GWA2_43_13]HAZ16808.1 peptidylprolyl isomerase [Candidatus Jacksonbacteria bacterium]